MDGVEQPIWRLSERSDEQRLERLMVLLAVGVAVVCHRLIVLTECSTRWTRKSFLVRPVSLLRNYLLPLGALLVLLVKATQIPTEETQSRLLHAIRFVVMCFCFGINATSSGGAEGTGANDPRFR